MLSDRRKNDLRRPLKEAFNDNGGDECGGIVAIDIREANGDGSAFFVPLLLLKQLIQLELLHQKIIISVLMIFHKYFHILQ